MLKHRKGNSKHKNQTRRNKKIYRNKRIICNKQTPCRNQTRRRNRVKGGNYDMDITTKTLELVPMKSKDVVVAMPGYVLSAKDYQKHMEYKDFQGSS